MVVKDKNLKVDKRNDKMQIETRNTRRKWHRLKERDTERKKETISSETNQVSM